MEYLYSAAILVVGMSLFIMFYLNSKNPKNASPSKSGSQSGEQPSDAGTARQVQKLAPQRYQAEFSNGTQAHTLLDVRTPEEFATGHILGAHNIALQDLPARWNELPKNQPLVLYCRTGNRSGMAAKLALQAGFSEVYNLGGVVEWHKQGLPLE